jgi:hypothetical protein
VPGSLCVSFAPLIKPPTPSSGRRRLAFRWLSLRFEPNPLLLSRSPTMQLDCNRYSYGDCGVSRTTAAFLRSTISNVLLRYLQELP